MDNEFYVNNDWMLRIRTQVDANAEVDRILTYCDKMDIQKLVCVFFNFRTKQVRVRNRKAEKNINKNKKIKIGGSTGFEHPLYEILQAADSCHDFGKEALTHFPNMASKMNLPNGFNHELFGNETKFIGFFAKRKSLVFDGMEFENPLYKASIGNVWSIEDELGPCNLTHAEKLSNLETKINKAHESFIGKLANKSTKLKSLDLFTIFTSDGPFGQKLEILKLTQVARLCQQIRDLIETDAMQGFVVDNSNDHLVLLLFATEMVSIALLNRFIIEPTLETQEALKSKKMQEALRQHMMINGIGQMNWHTEITDANLFDANLNSVPLPDSDQATGKIFKPSSPFNIRLNGLTKNKHGRFVDVTFTDNGKEVGSFQLTNKLCMKHFSINALAPLLDLKLDLKLETNTNPFTTQTILGFSKELQYALKRGGDWGQVEHCKKYGKVFVTGDKLAALYAFFREVKFIYVKRFENNVPVTHTRYPHFIRHSFTIN